MFKRFGPNDVIYNTVVTHPETTFYIHKEKIYLNNEFSTDGSFSNKVNHVPQGHLSLYEININRPSDGLVYPFITKEGARIAFKTVTTSQFDDSSQFRYGDTIKGSYPLSASVSRIYSEPGSPYKIYDEDGAVTFTPSESKKYILALKSQFENSTPVISSEKFKYENFESSEVNMICVPSIFYGSRIKRGSLELNYYLTGSLVATLKDEKLNGEMVQTFGTGTGLCAGVVFYELGIIALTGSWNLSTTHTEQYLAAGVELPPRWTNFGAGIPTVGKSINPTDVTDSSCALNFKGENKIPIMTLFAHSEEGEHNYSHNPTFIDKNHEMKYVIKSSSYIESGAKIKNIKKSQFTGYEEPFEKITYISKIGIYDENKNLIAVANLANPVKKRENRDFTFKMRVDF